MKIFLNRRLPLDIFGTSMTLFHYYSYYKSFREIDKIQLAIASLFLGCKLHSIFLNIDEAKKDYKEQSNGNSQPFDVVRYEVELLYILGFDLDISTPYAYIATYARKMDIQDSEKVIALAFNLTNDSYRRPFCVHFSSKQIALASLYLAINMLNEQGFSIECLPDVERYNKNEIKKCIDLILVLFEDRLRLA
jgi:hypothetical protein